MFAIGSLDSGDDCADEIEDGKGDEDDDCGDEDQDGYQQENEEKADEGEGNGGDGVDADRDLEVEGFFAVLIDERGFVFFSKPEDERGDDVAEGDDEADKGEQVAEHGKGVVVVG